MEERERMRLRHAGPGAPVGGLRCGALGQGMPLLQRLPLVVLLLVISVPRLAVSEEVTVYPVDILLRAAVEELKIGGSTAARDEAVRITSECLTPAAGTAWKEGFEAAVQSMLQKTKRSMQIGLTKLAQETATLLEATTCGKLAAFDSLRAQVGRLQVLASSRRSIANLDSKVKYVPLKALMVGGIDVHEELNALIVTWQLQKGPEEMGRTLARFLVKFSDGYEEEVGGAQPSEPETTTSGSLKADPAPQKRQLGADFWADVLNAALLHLAANSQQLLGADCITEGVVKEYGSDLDASFRSMMQKTRGGMEAGLRALARSTVALLDRVASSCPGAAASTPFRRLQSACSRLALLARAKNLINPTENVQYEALKALKVFGIDVHIELNRFISAWLSGGSADQLGKALADFFEDFGEREEQDDDPGPAEGASKVQMSSDPIWNMLRDAFGEAATAQGYRDEEFSLPLECFPGNVTSKFAADLNAAINHMLEKRKRTMQQGLKGFGDATDALLSSAPPSCIWSSGAKVVWMAAKKLSKLTRSTVVDYGKNIKYEAMKSLTVGGVTVHTELNQFLAAWKLRSQEESGKPFGVLMQRFSTIKGHDEL